MLAYQSHATWWNFMVGSLIATIIGNLKVLHYRLSVFGQFFISQAQYLRPAVPVSEDPHVWWPCYMLASLFQQDEVKLLFIRSAAISSWRHWTTRKPILLSAKIIFSNLLRHGILIADVSCPRALKLHNLILRNTMIPTVIRGLSVRVLKLQRKRLGQVLSVSSDLASSSSNSDLKIERDGANEEDEVSSKKVKFVLPNGHSVLKIQEILAPIPLSVRMPDSGTTTQIISS